MAEIRVERRKPGVWPWVLGLTVLALLIWGLTELLGRDDDAANEVMRAPVTAPGQADGTAAVAARLRQSVPHASIPDGRGIS